MRKKIKTHWNEQWVVVPSEYETKEFDYYFSNYGKLKSVNKATGDERLLQGSNSKYGFIQLNLRFKGGKRKGYYVHRMVAKEFMKNDDPEKKFLVHIDGNKKNNYYQNLRWVNQKELTEHQTKQGKFEARNNKSVANYKMNESKVALLKKWLAENKTKKRILARRFGITQMQVLRIERGENWGHVEAAE